jgi:hypothetical protein
MKMQVIIAEAAAAALSRMYVRPSTRNAASRKWMEDESRLLEGRMPTSGLCAVSIPLTHARHVGDFTWHTHTRILYYSAIIVMVEESCKRCQPGTVHVACPQRTEPCNCPVITLSHKVSPPLRARIRSSPHHPAASQHTFEIPHHPPTHYCQPGKMSR